jgi:RNA polymerase sigma factor (sigma-70 family)
MTKRLNKRTQKIFNKHTNLVDIQIALLRKKIPLYYSTEDLRSYGYIGLIDAIGKYDKQKGAGFLTYATKRIRGAILDGMRKMDWKPQGRNGHKVRVQLGLKDAEEIPWDNDRLDPEQYGCRRHERMMLLNSMGGMRPQAQIAIMLYYFNPYPYYQWEIGDMLNVGEARVSQLLTEGEAILKDNLHRRGWIHAET